MKGHRETGKGCFEDLLVPPPSTFSDTSGSGHKEHTCNAEDLDQIPGLGRSPRGGYGNSLWYSCLANPYGQRSLGGYSPRGCKESMGSQEDTTKRLSTAQQKKKCVLKNVNFPSVQFSRSVVSDSATPRDGGAWWAAVYGVAQSRTRLK